MRMSQLLFKTEKESPADARLISHRLLLRAGLVKQVSAGVYSLTPLAWRTLQRISEIARSEMNRIGGQEILLPVAQPASLWEETDRYETIDASLVRWRDRSGQDMVLAMTNEEAVTDLVRHVVHSYRQLPIAVYQIQTKYRDEARPRGGLIRLREFLMKDAYSFHRDADSLAKYYAQMSGAYESFYRRCGIETIKVESDAGMMGGGVTHEFMLLSADGEDTLLLCAACQYAANREVFALHNQDEQSCPRCGDSLRSVRGIEVGNIFQLGTKYSEAMGARFADEAGVMRPLVMGCYGIGISRMLACIVEANHDAAGIVWPDTVAPYRCHLIAVGSDQDVQSACAELYAWLGADTVLFDDRNVSAGKKFQDADLLGMPVRIAVSRRSLAAGGVEVRRRRTGETTVVALQDVVAAVDALFG